MQMTKALGLRRMEEKSSFASVGLEDHADLINDLHQALARG